MVNGLPRFATPPTCYRSLSGPKCPESVFRGVSGALRAPGSGVSKKCPESVPGVSKRCPGHSVDTLGTLFGHSGARGPKGPRDTPKDTLGTLRARRARETPVAGRGGCNPRWAVALGRRKLRSCGARSSSSSHLPSGTTRNPCVPPSTTPAQR